MKRRKCFKTILSGILAAVMIITAAPMNSLTVSAAQVDTGTTEVTPVSEFGAVPEQTTAQPEEVQAVNINDGTEGDEDETGGTTGTSAEVVSPVINGTDVTFNYDGSGIADGTKVSVKGSMDPNWSVLHEMTKPEGSDVYTVTITVEKAGKYEYGFEVGGVFETDPKNPLHVSGDTGNSIFIIQGLVGYTGTLSVVKGNTLALPEQLDAYTENSGTNTEKVDVTYSLPDSVSDGIELTTNDDGQSILSVGENISSDVNSVSLTAQDDEGNTCTVEVSIQQKVYVRDENHASPVVGKGKATFYYFGPNVNMDYGVKIDLGPEDGAWTKTQMTFDAETGYWYVTLLLAVGEYSYGFHSGSDSAWDVDAEGQTNAIRKTEGGNNFVTITEASGIISPEIEGNKVTFRYDAPTAEKVFVAGTMNGWGPDVDLMTKNETTGYWELTMEGMEAGEYQYKFVVGDGDWQRDPNNENLTDGNDPNNLFWIAGLANGNGKPLNVTRGGSLELPPKLTLYDALGGSEDVAVTYELSAEASDDLKDAIKLDEDDETGITTVSVTEDFPLTVTSFTLTAKAESGETSTVTITVPSKLYNYTIYYYDDEHYSEETGKDSAALWIWTDGVSGVLYPFTSTEELDGQTWLKAEVSLPYTDLQIIPRNAIPAGEWVWQDATREYSNATEAESTTLYMMYDDSAKIYTEKPEVQVREKRYLVVEYERNDGSAENWYFYTWNNGYTSGGFYPFKEVDGVWKAEIPVARGLSSVEYCIEKGQDAWTDKDGGNYLCTIPVDQNVVKIKMSEGKGITYTYPYNTGYEIAPKEGKIHFYYRNDDAFRQGSTGGFESVEIEINGTLYPMKWDLETQRYTYDLDDLAPGTYKYRYALKETEDAEAQYVLDKYNESTVTESGVEYSVCEYQLFDVVVQASVWNPTMDYNDNNVLSISFEGKDGADISGIEASSIVADLSALGGGLTSVDSELMELSIAVKEGTSTGTKIIPITVVDQYKNEYKTQTTVTVVDRNKENDFDWDEAIIYFAVTDRFFDGNTSNNGIGYDTDSATGPSSYHGGDFAGLTQKLDYLKDLGVNTIWITPIVEQQPTANVDSATGILAWGYHGYWAKNFENLDSHLGTEEEFSALLDAAHARGMKIMVDVVLNHSGYNAEGSTELTDYFDNQLENGMFRTAAETINGSDQQASLSGLPDFRTEDPAVRDLLVEWQSKWISKYPIDYYRVDTVKHVDATTWSAFKNALTKINPDFKMIGEYSGAGYATETGMLRTGRMDSLLDFDFNDRAVAFATGDMSGTESFLTARNASIDNTATLGAFLSSHDEDGLIYTLIMGTEEEEKEPRMSEAEALNLAKVAASLQLTTKGQVVIYYGEEVGQYGQDNYPYQTNRYDFDWARTEESANNTTLAHYKKLLSIRNEYLDVFAKGTRTTITADDARGLDVFARSYGNATVYVALNIADKEVEYNFEGLVPNSALKNIYSGELCEVDENGKATVTIPAAKDGGTAIFVKSDYHAGEFWIDGVADQTYTGKNITLSEAQLKVYYGLTELKLGTDYTVKYKNNKAVGTATITVTGKGNYAGKETATFNILPKNIAETDIEYQDAMIETGKNLKPLTKITNNGTKLGSKDYKAVYYLLDENGNRTGDELTSIKAAGNYELVITGLYDAENNKGSYTGSVTKPIKIYEKGSVTYIKDTTITFDGKKSFSTVYTGEAIEPEMIVTPKGSKEPLTLGTEYTVAYNNQKEVGTAEVTITGVPAEGYIGSVTKTYKITGVKLSTVAQVDATNWQTKVVYDVVSGKAVQSTEVGLIPKKSDSEDTFTEGIDYTVSYLKNTSPGSATMVFTGKGKYTGTVTKKFTVSKVELKADDSRLKYTVAATAPYAKKGATPVVTVSYDNIPLREGVDYKLTYSNNKAITTEETLPNKMPYVKITGAGAFSGTIQNTDAEDDITDTTFSVVKSNLNTLNLTAVDKVFKNSKGAFVSAPVLTDNGGSKLTNKKDYVVQYYLVDADGTVSEEPLDSKAIVEIAEGQDYTTIKMVADAAENSAYYEGSISTTYRVVKANISSAKVTINAKVYTGKAITLDELDFTKIKVGTEDLTYGTDYEIVKDSYVNNINKGTASVTIQGLGNYGGTKKVTFKITNRTIAWWWNLLF